MPSSVSSRSNTDAEKNVEPSEQSLSIHPHAHEVSEEERQRLAVYEGHDADIPSNEGYVLDARGELKRKQSLQRRKNRTDSHIYKIGALEDSGDAEKSADDEEGGQPSDEDENDDPNIVWWDGDDDPANPMNWKTSKKILNVALVSAVTFITPLASCKFSLLYSHHPFCLCCGLPVIPYCFAIEYLTFIAIFAPGVPLLMAEFHSTSPELASFVVSVYILGFAVGPLFLAPLSELYGRVPLYHITNFLFIIFTVACALSPSLGALIAFRLLAGAAGSAALTNGGGTIADLIPIEKRGFAMSVFVIGPLLGPVIGPVAGGYLAESLGWRWVFWVLAITMGAFSLCCLIFLRETYAPVLLEKKAAKLRKATGNAALHSKLDVGISAKDLFLRAIVRPTKILFLSPVIFILSLYMAIVYGYLYLLFTTFTLIFEQQYGFSSGSVGLSFLGIGIGSMLGLGIFGYSSDKILRASARNSQNGSASHVLPVYKPEYRLPPMVPGSIIIPIGLLIYGWTAQNHVQFIVPIFGTLLIGIGNLAVFMCIQTYIVDAFTVYAASALAANTVLRSIGGAILPLAGGRMYQTLGIGWGNTLIALIGVALLPVPWLLIIYGERLRIRFEIKNL
jgi:multidrug resistance protein